MSRGTIKEREANIKSLPDELLFDILVRFPADFLRERARLVCRRWCHIIHSDAFINTHFQGSTYGLLLSSPSLKIPHSIYVTATQGGRIVTSEITEIFRTRITATCNGLAVELFDFNAGGESLSLHVINPATKQSFRLPSLSTHNRNIYHYLTSIAYSAASMRYKVILPSNRVDHSHVRCLDIVTVGVDQSWRRVEIPPLPERVGELLSLFPLTTEGFLHWLWGIERYILTLNVDTEMITMSEAPISPESHHYSYYLSTGRYLTLLVGRGEFSWEVWEMKPESGEWRKVLPNIDLEAKKCWLRQKFAFKSDEYLYPLGWVKYPEILAFCFSGLGRTCIFYNRETREIKTIKLPYNACSDYRAFLHRNSLVCI